MACEYSPPKEIVESILRKYPKAAIIKDNFGHTPLHLSVLRGSEETASLFSQLAPESILSFDAAGKIPLYYCIEHGFVKNIEVMLELCPTALLKINIRGETALDFFCKRRFRFIYKMLHYSSPSIDQVPTISMSNKECQNNYEMGRLILFHQYNINSQSSSDNFSLLESAIISSSCPWIFCEFLVRMAPYQLEFVEKDFFRLLNTNTKKHIYDKIFTCSVCSDCVVGFSGSICSNFVVCDKCGKGNQGSFKRDEELEECQFIFVCLLMHPTLCADYG